MTFHNNLVLTPVRAVHINDVIDKINKGISRPVTYSYYVGGFVGAKYDGTVLYLGFIPLPLKLNPTVIYEIVARGRIPQDDGALLYGNTATSVGTLQPFCILHGVGLVPDGDNSAKGYNSKGQNPRMSIYPGSQLVERPQFSSDCKAAVNGLAVGDPWHLDVGVMLAVDETNTRPDAGNYKDDFTAPDTIWPSFQLNVTVYYEQGVTI